MAVARSQHDADQDEAELGEGARAGAGARCATLRLSAARRRRVRGDGARRGSSGRLTSSLLCRGTGRGGVRLPVARLGAYHCTARQAVDAACSSAWLPCRGGERSRAPGHRGEDKNEARRGGARRRRHRGGSAPLWRCGIALLLGIKVVVTGEVGDGAVRIEDARRWWWSSTKCTRARRWRLPGSKGRMARRLLFIAAAG